ncbi:hypothetical protein KIH74_28265 [Kineosporia sp. J2-2]|uniref:Zinc ribbon domain-containing protein n=1 Tax=Kineosporia corallincola TaxID=2835133 RepID=A0ABS5TPE5_9ACTN|nr:zinc ribbon domain-containing protein [Kineosporia corallincola]MBT0772870.1 hypothetical protein [Kineosporia corallincola]
MPDDRPGVGEVAPGKPDPVRPVTRTPSATQEHGVRCWNCSVDNRSDRIFCRNCGVELNRRPAPAPVARPSWWRRLRDRLDDVNRFAVGAGLLALLLVLAAVLLAKPLYYRYQDRFSTPVAIPPVAVDASSTDPAHPPASAFDGGSNTWWGPGYSGESRGQFLRAVIQPTDLRAVRITPGVSPRPELRDRQARPHTLTLVVFDQRGRRTTKNVTLEDYTPELVRIRVDDAVQVLLVLGDGFGTSDSKEIAIAEVELYRY